MQATVMSLTHCSPDPEKAGGGGFAHVLEFIREDPHRARVMLIDAFTVGS